MSPLDVVPGPAPKVKVETRVADRVVLTLSLDGVDMGVLIAYPWQGGYALEHVVTYPQAPPTALLALLEAGIEEANKRKAAHVAIFQPKNGIDPRLRELAAAVGFEPYHVAEDGVYLVLRAA